MESFATSDKLFESREFVKGLEELKKRREDGEMTCDLLWRMCRFCHELSTTMSGEQRRKMLIEGRDYGLEAMDLDPSSFLAAKWTAIMFGLVVDQLPTKEKINDGGRLKDMLDKALELDPTDFALLHLRARFSYTIANLSWLERKAASMLYSEVPKATIDDALVDFKAAYNQNADWIENLLFLSKCHLAKKEKQQAREMLNKAIVLPAASSNDAQFVTECKSLLQKC
ncbi:Regulator of microtubule dynamics protein 1 [Caenorhabditis elegans]|uniref:Regulator of microtubule dynamics protein 1 n=2 Tax=Caenorhabditis elegans TaxID=6239 RepID=RMD1_CAEEL|nr:Regulator of microtubule dynamics protein 1 [Caenorhabditis elegans]P34560.2 RecName: Full=Regulator of microtubule dynamics protein 1 [Caenorhabditis elegans]CCF23359.1 Regulator of microtubule dynamics protein 1 [Caenorhabditis elegans]|eukprot:NP_001255029.1 Regulator of microtubule dynamics protein 1 [Caenorhabditis elegans]